MTDMRTPDDFLRVLDELARLGRGSVQELEDEARKVLQALRAGQTPFPESRPGGAPNLEGGWDEPSWAITMKEKRRSFFKVAVIAALWRIGEHVTGADDPIARLVATLVGRPLPVLREKSFGTPEQSFFDDYLRSAVGALDSRMGSGGARGIGLAQLAAVSYGNRDLGTVLSTALSVETIDWLRGQVEDPMTLKELAFALWRTWQSHFKPAGGAGTVVLPTDKEYGAASLQLELHLRPLLAQVFEYKAQEARRWSGTPAREFTLKRLNRVDSDANNRVIYHGRDVLHVRYALLAEQLLAIYAAICDGRIGALGAQLSVTITPRREQLTRAALERIDAVRKAQGAPPPVGKRGGFRVLKPVSEEAAVGCLTGASVGLLRDDDRRHPTRSCLSVGLVDLRRSLPGDSSWMELAGRVRRGGQDSALPLLLEDVDPDEDLEAMAVISAAKEDPSGWQRLWLDARSEVSVDEVRAALSRPGQVSFWGYGRTGAGVILLLLIDLDAAAQA